jgi:hypothetical protein
MQWSKREKRTDFSKMILDHCVCWEKLCVEATRKMFDERQSIISSERWRWMQHAWRPQLVWEKCMGKMENLQKPFNCQFATSFVCQLVFVYLFHPN